LAIKEEEIGLFRQKKIKEKISRKFLDVRSQVKKRGRTPCTISGVSGSAQQVPAGKSQKRTSVMKVNILKTG